MLAWLHTGGLEEPLRSLRIALDGAAVCCCAATLWRVRKDPSI